MADLTILEYKEWAPKRCLQIINIWLNKKKKDWF